MSEIQLFNGDCIRIMQELIDDVLDFCMGSGSTGVACRNLNRSFIGIELNEEYYKIATERINDTQTRLL